MAKKILFVSLVILFSVSCTKLEMALNWADTFALNQIEDYFDLDRAQEKQIKQDFRAALHQVQEKDFPQLADALSRMADSVEKNELTIEKSHQYYNEVEALIKGSVAKFEPMGQKLVSDQARSNFDSFDQEFSKKLGKDQKKFQSLEAAQKDFKKRFDKWVDETVENLTPEQEKSFSQWQQKNQNPVLLRLESRKAVHEKFKSVRQDEKQRTEMVKTFFFNWDSLQTVDYLKARKAYQDSLKNWAFTQLTQLNEKQRKNLVENLRKRSGEFATLAKK